jgi:hypothetical protein
MAEYRPSGIPAREWTVVRPFVLALAAELGLQHCGSAQRTVRALTRLAAWAAGEGLPLDAEVVLDPASVERFVALGLVGDRSRATYRSVLRRVGPRLTRHAPWEARPASVARRQVAMPYTARELDRLRVASRAQPTPGQNARRVHCWRSARALGLTAAGRPGSRPPT